MPRMVHATFLLLMQSNNQLRMYNFDHLRHSFYCVCRRITRRQLHVNQKISTFYCVCRVITSLPCPHGAGMMFFLLLMQNDNDGCLIRSTYFPISFYCGCSVKTSQTNSSDPLGASFYCVYRLIPIIPFAYSHDCSVAFYCLYRLQTKRSYQEVIPKPETFYCLCRVITLPAIRTELHAVYFLLLMNSRRVFLLLMQSNNFHNTVQTPPGWHLFTAYAE